MKEGIIIKLKLENIIVKHLVQKLDPWRTTHSLNSRLYLLQQSMGFTFNFSSQH